MALLQFSLNIDVERKLRDSKLIFQKLAFISFFSYRLCFFYSNLEFIGSALSVDFYLGLVHLLLLLFIVTLCSYYDVSVNELCFFISIELNYRFLQLIISSIKDMYDKPSLVGRETHDRASISKQSRFFNGTQSTKH